MADRHSWGFSTHADTPLAYSFEIEFMVAQELPQFNYKPVSNEWLVKRPWACPAEEKAPYTAILGKCKDLLVANNYDVAVCEDPSARETTVTYFPGQNASPMGRWSHWLIEPSVTTYARRHSPQMLEWYGVRLRSPACPEARPRNRMSPASRILRLLREELVIHLNSTCRFNVHVMPARTVSFSLLIAKKLTTLVWLLEKELLERVCPNSFGLPFEHVRTLETSSRISSLVWHGSAGRSRPEDPLRAAITQRYLPNLRNKDLLARLQLVWDASSVEELSKGLLGVNGEAISFAIHPEVAQPHDSTFEFRYALWHPYGELDELDASDYWIDLSLILLRAAIRKADNFRPYISQLDDLIHGFSVNSTPPAYRWKMLLATLGLTEAWCAPWEAIIDHYKSGQRLDHRFIDKQDILQSPDKLGIDTQTANTRTADI